MTEKRVSGDSNIKAWATSSNALDAVHKLREDVKSDIGKLESKKEQQALPGNQASLLPGTDRLALPGNGGETERNSKSSSPENSADSKDDHVKLTQAEFKQYKDLFDKNAAEAKQKEKDAKYHQKQAEKKGREVEIEKAKAELIKAKDSLQKIESRLPIIAKHKYEAQFKSIEEAYPVKNKNLLQSLRAYAKSKQITIPIKGVDVEIAKQILIDNDLLKSEDYFLQQESDKQSTRAHKLQNQIEALTNVISEPTDDDDEHDTLRTIYEPPGAPKADSKSESKLPSNFVYNDKRDYDGSSSSKDIEGDGYKQNEDGLYESQINDTMKKYQQFLGTFAIDELHDLENKIEPKTQWGAIINLDKRKGGGSHWVAMYGDGRANGSQSIEYYNSFGEPAPKPILAALKGIAKKMNSQNYLKFKENKIVQQDNNSSNCGPFAMHFLIQKFRGKPFPEASGYDEHIKAEKDIEAFKKKLNIQPFKYVDSFNGDGLVDIAKDIASRVKGFFTGRTKPPPAVRNLVSKERNEKITSMKVVRSPVSSVVQNILNTISGGQIEQNRMNLHYDNIYHLGLQVTLANGHSFVLERNQSVQVNPVRAFEAERTVNIGKDIMLGELLENGAKDDKNFWRYNPVTSNCQQFVTALLKGSNLMNSELDSFINQNAVKLLENSPLTKKIAESVSDFASRLDILLHGAGAGAAANKGSSKGKFSTMPVSLDRK
jgi:hypothetical protein